jgi:hypothetical protein
MKVISTNRQKYSFGFDTHTYEQNISLGFVYRKLNIYLENYDFNINRLQVNRAEGRFDHFPQ